MFDRDRWRQAFILLLVVSVFSGCAIVTPFVATYKEMGVSAADRERLLREKVEAFNRAVYWGRPEEAVALAKDESKQELKRLLRSRRRKEKIVETKLDFVDMLDDAYKADVEVLVRYYKVPYYVVTDRIEKQSWEFSFTSGWEYVTQETLDANS